MAAYIEHQTIEAINYFYTCDKWLQNQWTQLFYEIDKLHSLFSKQDFL